MAKYIHIEDRVFTELELSGNDAIIYALVAGYCNAGKRFECKVDDVAKRVNMSEHGVRKAINRLCAGGYLEKERKQLSFVLSLSDAWKDLNRVAKSDEQERHKVTDRTAQSDAQERHKVTDTHYIINNSNKTYIKAEFEPKSTYQGIAVELFAEHFKQTHNGREYTPNPSTNTTTFYDLCDKIKSCMTTDGYVADPDTFRTYFGQWIVLAWDKTDQWHRERWSAEFVNSQFIYFDNIINSTDNGNKKQSSNEISDEYIAKQLAIIMHAESARAAGAGADPGSQGTGR